MLTTALVIVAVTAALLVLLGLRTHGPGYPSCGVCGYDVSGSLGTVARCPECGTPFAEAGVVPARRGSGTPRRRAAVVVLLLGAVVVTGLLLTQAAAKRAQVRAMEQMRAAQQQMNRQITQLRDLGIAEAAAAAATQPVSRAEEDADDDAEPGVPND